MILEKYIRAREFKLEKISSSTVTRRHKPSSSESELSAYLMLFYLVDQPCIRPQNCRRACIWANIASKHVLPHANLVEWIIYSHPSCGSKLSWWRCHTIVSWEKSNANISYQQKTYIYCWNKANSSIKVAKICET